MSESGSLDVRLPIGTLFVILGALLIGYGLIGDAVVGGRGGKVNEWWGAVMAIFGAVMLVLVWRGGRRAAL